MANTLFTTHVHYGSLTPPVKFPPKNSTGLQNDRILRFLNLLIDDEEGAKTKIEARKKIEDRDFEKKKN